LRTGFIATGVVALAVFSLITHRQLGYWQNSRLLFQHSLAVTGPNTLAQIKLGEALLEAGQIEPGFANLNAVLQAYPTLVNPRMDIAEALALHGRFQEAVDQYNQVLQSNPDYPEALNNLAWIFSTNPDANLHNGPRAMELAQQACELTKFHQTIYIGTLAAAYAAAGRFDEAIATAQQACDVAKKNGETSLRQKNQELLERYRQHQTAQE
jgi:tetratricopeptide (TPR) repeat protein